MESVASEFQRFAERWEHEIENLTYYGDLKSLFSFKSMVELGLDVLPLALDLREKVEHARLIVWALLEEIEEMLISGEHRFTDEELRFYFELLAEKWEWESAPMSSTTQMSELPSYQAIVVMGEAAVPWILGNISRDSSFLISALREITGECPILKEHAGSVKLMVKDWLNWAEEKGINYEDEGSKITPESWQQMLAQVRNAAAPGLAENLKSRQVGRRAGGR